MSLILTRDVECSRCGKVSHKVEAEDMDIAEVFGRLLGDAYTEAVEEGENTDFADLSHLFVTKLKAFVEGGDASGYAFTVALTEDDSKGFRILCPECVGAVRKLLKEVLEPAPKTPKEITEPKRSPGRPKKVIKAPAKPKTVKEEKKEDAKD